jgi:CHAT domain-containing protein/Tfp pilus assembly protein PilF
LDEAKRLDDQVEKLYVEGKYEAALQPAEKSLTIRQKQLGPDHLLVADSLNNIAALYFALGDYVKAEPRFKQALEIREKQHEDLLIANSLNSLAGLYQARGDYDRAEPLFKRALEIREKKLGSEHPVVARMLNNLGLLYQKKRDYVQAEPLFKRALEIRQKTLPADHPDIAKSLNNLAVMYQELGRLDEALPLYTRALDILEKKLGPAHPNVANAIHNLAVLYLLKKEYALAEPLYQRALNIIEKAEGSEHPDFANALESFAIMYETKGDIARAIELQKRASDIREHNLALILTSGSEDQKRLYIDTLSIETDMAISLHVRSAPNNQEAARLALTTILRRKGRVLDAMADSLGTLRRRSKPEDRELLDRLSAVRSRLATLVFSGSSTQESQAEIAKLTAEGERLEAAISSSSAEYRAQSEPATVDKVQQAIPPDSALVEIAVYRPFNLTATKKSEGSGSTRYVAYVLRPKGEPLWVEIGNTSDIDRNIGELRTALSNPGSRNIKQVARTLEESVMRPIRALLGNTKQIFLSPDGALNLIPFSALVDEQNRYLVETYTITYLTAGSDLLRLQIHEPSKQGPVVVADPAFNSNLVNTTQTQRSVDFGQAGFGSLPGTAGEARALKKILSGATVFTGDNASESAVKKVKGPRILHVATHGFFLPDDKSSTGTEAQNPLLRSGIVLAGANRRQGGEGEDGILTALEAAQLDLSGTKIVVLSACQTGVGEVRNGDGVYGLRRALILAGSESQVMSLWKVDDEATRDLMVEYYKRLNAGEGRTEALRQVQLKMLRGNRQAQGANKRSEILDAGTAVKTSYGRSHPYYWASFIQSGDWKGTEEK